jgi:hypothetical protein
MKKLLLYLSYEIYLLFILGFVLSTSADPVILGKYSLKDAGFLLIIILLFLPYRKIVTFLLSESSIILGNGNVFRFTPVRKFIFYFALFNFCVLLLEVFLRFQPHDLPPIVCTTVKVRVYLSHNPKPHLTINISMYPEV